SFTTTLTPIRGGSCPASPTFCLRRPASAAPLPKRSWPSPTHPATAGMPAGKPAGGPAPTPDRRAALVGLLVLGPPGVTPPGRPAGARSQHLRRPLGSRPGAATRVAVFPCFSFLPFWGTSLVFGPKTTLVVAPVPRLHK